VICLFQVIQEGNFGGGQEIAESQLSVADKFLSAFKTSLENKSMKGLKADAISWMMLDDF